MPRHGPQVNPMSSDDCPWFEIKAHWKEYLGAAAGEWCYWGRQRRDAMEADCECPEDREIALVFCERKIEECRTKMEMAYSQLSEIDRLRYPDQYEDEDEDEDEGGDGGGDGEVER